MSSPPRWPPTSSRLKPPRPWPDAHEPPDLDRRTLEAAPGIDRGGEGRRLRGRAGDVHAYKNVAWNRHEAITQAQGIAIANAAESFVGQKYLFRAIFAIACKILHIPLPKRFYGDLDKAKGAICSEFVVKARRKAGVPIEGKKSDYLVSPADLANRLLYI